MKLQRVERHIIKPSDKRFKAIADISHKSKNLYNYANYILRQEFIANKSIPKEYDLTGMLAKESQTDYKALPAQTAQQTIKLLYRNYKAFFQALKSYKKDKSNFTSNPKLPKYKKKDGFNTVIFTNQQVKIKSGEKRSKLAFPKTANGEILNLEALNTNIDFKTSSLKQVRLIPKPTCFIVEVVYEIEQKNVEFVKDSFLAIDLGLNNFVTSIDNQSGKPFIINGKGIKSVNQFYNKLRSKYQAKAKSSNDRYFTKRLVNLNLARETKINDFMHKASNYVIKHCLKYKIESVVIGLNRDWKQRINHGKQGNQNFVSVPFTSFVSKLAYKCENYGIKFFETEESYTSKCDHLANEPMEHRENYLGKRVKRGLFKSSTGKYLNADLNGAIGIARKVFRDAAQALVDSGTAFMPIKINLA